LFAEKQKMETADICLFFNRNTRIHPKGHIGLLLPTNQHMRRKDRKKIKEKGGRQNKTNKKANTHTQISNQRRVDT
jgi:hypothetical protein